MEKFTTYVGEANKAFKTADHLIYVTYPVLQDNKLMATALEHLYVALSSGMAALLYYDAAYKRISIFPHEFATQFKLFKESTAKRYGINEDMCLVISDVAELVHNRRDSPIEFSRRDKYVIASETYKLRTITLEKMKRFLLLSKTFMERVNKVHAAYDGRFS
ncbi:MAG: hypothetical protein AABX72_05115 [Nanoarchaeota archaeon]